MAIIYTLCPFAATFEGELPSSDILFVIIRDDEGLFSVKFLTFEKMPLRQTEGVVNYFFCLAISM